MKKLELILSKIPDANQCPPRRAGWAGKAYGSRAKNFLSYWVGGKEFLPALAFPPPNFVFRFAKNAARKGVAFAPALPCAGNDKELPFTNPLKSSIIEV